jgi:hypothetical protein
MEQLGQLGAAGAGIEWTEVVVILSAIPCTKHHAVQC